MNYSFLKFDSLTTGQHYQYSCYTSTSKLGDFTFKFPNNTGSTKIIAFGDWSDASPTRSKSNSSGPTTLKYLQKILQNKNNDSYDLIVFAGDLAYDLHGVVDNSKNPQLTLDNGVNGNKWLKKIMPITNRYAFMFSPGNHEGREKGMKSFLQRFYLPNNNQYYSYDINNVHFISANSIPWFDDAKTFTSKTTEAFTTWLQKDLQSNGGKQWKVLYLHHPFYCSYTGHTRCSSEAANLRNALEDYVKNNKVDLVIQGHVHWYERTMPVYKSIPDTKSASNDLSTFTNPIHPIYVVCGAGGNSEGIARSEDPAKPYGVKVIGKAGVCEIKFDSTKLTLNYLSSDDESILDTFSIIKTPSKKK